MESISALVVFVLFVGFIVLCVAAILMPLFVMAISSRAKSIDETLRKMEHMMRHGK